MLDRIQTKIDDLAIEPRPNGVKKLKGEENSYRITVGDYRVIYEIFDDVLLVKNDRDYQVGDTLTLIEIDHSNELTPTGTEVNKEVVYLLTRWGLEQSYVVLPIK